jgi:hypothetical protein
MFLPGTIVASRRILGTGWKLSDVSLGPFRASKTRTPRRSTAASSRDRTKSVINHFDAGWA